MSQKKLISYRDLSVLINMPVGTLQWLVHTRKIPFIRIGPRSVRFIEQDVFNWLEELKSLPKGVSNGKC